MELLLKNSRARAMINKLDEISEVEVEVEEDIEPPKYSKKLGRSLMTKLQML